MSETPRSSTTTEPGPCPSDLTLERHLAGELESGAPEAAHLATCARCAERLDAMRAEGAAYMQSDAAGALRAELTRREGLARRRRSLLFWSGVGLPLAAAATFLALLRPPAANDLTAKGAATVALLVVHGGEASPWAGGPLSRGDVLQLSWTSPRPGWVAVIGREEAGGVALWFPESDRAARLDAGTRTFGDALRFDPPFHGTVFVFVADRPFPVAPLVSAILQERLPQFTGEHPVIHVPGAP